MICMDSVRWVQGSKSGSIRRDVRITYKSSCPISPLDWMVHKFGSGQLLIPADYGMIWRQLHDIEQNNLNPNKNL
jgi:hypothetical protein